MVKTCRSNRETPLERKERVRVKNANYRSGHKDQISKRQREYRKENLEAFHEREAKRYSDNKEFERREIRPIARKTREI
jgi:uncharacterized metal-binding protein